MRCVDATRFDTWSQPIVVTTTASRTILTPHACICFNRSQWFGFVHITRGFSRGGPLSREPPSAARRVRRRLERARNATTLRSANGGALAKAKCQARPHTPVPRRRTFSGGNAVGSRSRPKLEGIQPETKAHRRPVRQAAAHNDALRGELAALQSCVTNPCEQIVLARSTGGEMVRPSDCPQEHPPCSYFSADSDWSTRHDPVQATVEISRTSAERNVSVAVPLGTQRTGQQQDQQQHY